jgi:hypothetical protein
MIPQAVPFFVFNAFKKNTHLLTYVAGIFYKKYLIEHDTTNV